MNAVRFLNEGHLASRQVPFVRRSRFAVLLVDVINAMRFPGGTQLAKDAQPVARAIVKLKRKARQAGVPVIYANDHFGDWRATSADIVRRCAQKKQPGSAFTRQVKPSARDSFVLKPRNSAFYCTSLEPLLEGLGARTLIVAGLTADNCVLFTAHDAYLRGFRVVIPEDAVASKSLQSTERALEQMRTSLKATVTSVEALKLGKRPRT